jgi:hypothetical protein
MASRSATLEEFATGADDAFARPCDCSHVHAFALGEGTSISPTRWWTGDEREEPSAVPRSGSVDCALVTRAPASSTSGDNWRHQCTIARTLNPRYADVRPH